jgi:acyl carrier protein
MSHDPISGSDLSEPDYLQKLWSTQLNLPRVNVNDDFFEAGGSSMQVIEMLMTVSNKFGKEIDYAEFFKDPSIRKLSELLDTE